MEHYLNLIFVGPSQLLPIGIGLLIWFGLASLGSLVTNKHRFSDANVVFGWAIISSLYTIIGVSFSAPFLTLSICAAIAAIIGLIISIRDSRPPFVPGFWKILICVRVREENVTWTAFQNHEIPVFFLMNAMLL